MVWRSIGQQHNMEQRGNFIAGYDDPILITGACRFIGTRFFEHLLKLGCRNLLCFIRPSSYRSGLSPLADQRRGGVSVHVRNLLPVEDCRAATQVIRIIYHLAAGGGETSLPVASRNSVVTTRNLLAAKKTKLIRKWQQFRLRRRTTE
jgi:nucleoside-diphosphate-sugar epimerase